jgi:peptide deformylase
MKIRTKGTPCLHIPSRPLSVVQPTKKILRLAQKMVNTMLKENGVGLAAPQIGKNIQMCIILDHQNEQIVCMINPRITIWSVEKTIEEEGCLSCPGETRHIERSKYVDVDYIGIDGQQIKRRYEGITARIIQHELDHLDGTLIVDYERIENERV